MRNNLQQICFLPATFSPSIERMGDADKCALFPQSPNRLQRAQPGRDLFGHIGGKDFPTGGHDLLTHDDQFRVEALSRYRSGN